MLKIYLKNMKTFANSQRGFAHVLLVIILAVAVLGVGAVAVKQFLKHRGPGGQGGLASWTAGCKGDQRVGLTHLPMDLGDVSSISPLGLTAGAHVTPIDHLYFYPKSMQRDAAPVYAMADGTIKEITARTVNVDTGSSKQAEYRIVIQHSCQTFTYFDLVTSLAPDIQAQLGKHKDGQVNIPVKAGQEIARIGAQSLDTAVYNLKLTLPGFIHPAMYKAEPWKVHTDDFFSYFNDTDQAAMAVLNQRKIKPLSGKIDYDQPGKLIGNWFEEGTNGYAGPKTNGQPGVGQNGHGYWSGHLSVHYDPFDGKSTIVSIGSFGADGQPQAFGVTAGAPDPATVSAASGVVKYELVHKAMGIAAPSGSLQQGPQPAAGVVLFQVEAGEKLKFEAFPGKTAAQVSGFTSAAKTYER